MIKIFVVNEFCVGCILHSVRSKRSSGPMAVCGACWHTKARADILTLLTLPHPELVQLTGFPFLCNPTILAMCSFYSLHIPSPAPRPSLLSWPGADCPLCSVYCYVSLIWTLPVAVLSFTPTIKTFPSPHLREVLALLFSCPDRHFIQQ